MYLGIYMFTYMCDTVNEKQVCVFQKEQEKKIDMT